jgi:peptidyl-prolyl cis-trans isomerase A (cyclophilin A)
MLEGDMKNRILALLALTLCAAPMMAQGSTSTEALPDAPSTAAGIHLPAPPSGPTVVMDTTMGRIVCKLYSKEAPVTSQNFIDLAEGKKDWTDPVSHRLMHGKRFYDNTTFHRVIPGFMAQGGDPSGTGMGDAGYYFNNEPTPELTFNRPGRLAMANSGPNTNSSQFFITEVPVPQLDGGYNLFGQCDDAGVAVVTAITHTPRDGQDKPLTPVVLKRVTIVRNGQPMPPLPGAAASTLPKPAPRPIRAPTGQ